MNPEEIEKLNRQLSERMADQIELAIRKWIEKSDDEKQKALLKTIETKEDQMRTLNEVGAHLVHCMKGLYNAVISKQKLTEEEKLDLVDTIEKSSRAFPKPIADKLAHS